MTDRELRGLAQRLALQTAVLVQQPTHGPLIDQTAASLAQASAVFAAGRTPGIVDATWDALIVAVSDATTQLENIVASGVEITGGGGGNTDYPPTPTGIVAWLNPAGPITSKPITYIAGAAVIIGGVLIYVSQKGIREEL